MSVKHQYANKINQLTASNLTLYDCQLFTYSLSNATCWVKYNAGRQNFRNIEKYTTFDGLSVSGDYNCKSKYSKGFPQILVNNEVIDARKVCHFGRVGTCSRACLMNCYSRTM